MWRSRKRLWIWALRWAGGAGVKEVQEQTESRHRKERGGWAADGKQLELRRLRAPGHAAGLPRLRVVRAAQLLLSSHGKDKCSRVPRAKGAIHASSSGPSATPSAGGYNAPCGCPMARMRLVHLGLLTCAPPRLAFPQECSKRTTDAMRDAHKKSVTVRTLTRSQGCKGYQVARGPGAARGEGLLHCCGACLDCMVAGRSRAWAGRSVALPLLLQSTNSVVTENTCLHF